MASPIYRSEPHWKLLLLYISDRLVNDSLLMFFVALLTDCNLQWIIQDFYMNTCYIPCSGCMPPGIAAFKLLLWSTGGIFEVIKWARYIFNVLLMRALHLQRFQQWDLESQGPFLLRNTGRLCLQISINWLPSSFLFLRIYKANTCMGSLWRLANLSVCVISEPCILLHFASWLLLAFMWIFLTYNRDLSLCMPIRYFFKIALDIASVCYHASKLSTTLH